MMQLRFSHTKPCSHPSLRLHEAVRTFSVSSVTTLLQSGMNPNLPDPDGLSPVDTCLAAWPLSTDPLPHAEKVLQCCATLGILLAYGGQPTSSYRAILRSLLWSSSTDTLLEDFLKIASLAHQLWHSLLIRLQQNRPPDRHALKKAKAAFFAFNIRHQDLPYSSLYAHWAAYTLKIWNKVCCAHGDSIFLHAADTAHQLESIEVEDIAPSELQSWPTHIWHAPPVYEANAEYAQLGNALFNLRLMVIECLIENHHKITYYASATINQALWQHVQWSSVTKQWNISAALLAFQPEGTSAQRLHTELFVLFCLTHPLARNPGFFFKEAPYMLAYFTPYSMPKDALEERLGICNVSISLLCGSLGGLAAAAIAAIFPIMDNQMQLDPHRYASFQRYRYASRALWQFYHPVYDARFFCAYLHKKIREIPNFLANCSAHQLLAIQNFLQTVYNCQPTASACQLLAASQQALRLLHTKRSAPTLNIPCTPENTRPSKRRKS